jgi:glycosyltransferase involved in cell wall biosynthesis
MRLVFVTRVMSGFATSLASGVWRPTGAPAIHRLMETVASRAPGSRFFLLCREAGFDFSAPWTTARDRDLKLDGFPLPLRALAGAHFFPRWLGRWRGHLSELRQLFVLLREIRRTRPDAVYFERGAALLAGIVARLHPGRVVLRVLGILPWMNGLAASTSIYHRLLAWAYRAPFGLVVCSEDGSGGRAWMAANLRPGVPRVTLLNGVDPQSADPANPALAALPEGRLVVLMLGRLETLRRCEDFVEGVLSLPAPVRTRIHALVVGDGPLRDRLVARVGEAGASDDFTFTGALPPSGVAAALARADVYVMLNDMCCLTNTTLEALRAGLCPVVLDPPDYLAGDPATERLLPCDVAIRIPRDVGRPPAEALSHALAGLASDPADLARRKTRAREVAEAELTGWDRRLGREIDLIARIAAGEPLAEHPDG